MSLPCPAIRTEFTMKLERELDITNSQSEVLGLLLYGLNAKEMTPFLNCTVATVKFHLCNLYRQFNVDSQTKLAIEVMRKGYIAPLEATKEEKPVEGLLPIGVRRV